MSLAMAAATFHPCCMTSVCSTPPSSAHSHRCNGSFSGYHRHFFTMAPWAGSAFPHALRIQARAGPRKESAKVRNRRIQRKFSGTPRKPRLSVFCSNDQLYAMIVDDQNKKTLFYTSTLQKSVRGDPPCTTIEAAKRVGEELIKTCIELNISEISSYDRNGFARGERMRAFEIAIAAHGFLPW